MKQATILIVMIILASIAAYAQVPPVLPSFFYGKATVNGRSVPAGSVIEAEISANPAGSISITAAGEYGSETTDNKLGVEGTREDQNAQIRFYLYLPGKEPIPAEETGVFRTAEITEQDLTFTGEEKPLPQDTGDTDDSQGTGSGTSTATGASGAGSSTGAPAAGGNTDRALFLHDIIRAGSQVDMVMDKSGLPFTRIQLILNNEKTEVSFRVEAVDEPDAPRMDGVYRYVEIEAPKVLDQDITAAIIRFRIENSWVAGYDPQSVTLYRYEDGWQALETVDGGSDSTHHYYRSQTTGFGLFAVAAQKTQPSAEEQQTQSPSEPAQPAKADGKADEDKQDKQNLITGMFVNDSTGERNNLGLAIVIIGLVALSLLAYHFIIKT